MRSWRFFNMILLLVVLQVMASVTGLTSKTNQDCDGSPIGLQYRNSVPDGRFKASSYYNQGTQDTRYKPSSARLHGNDGWAPRTNSNPKEYLQIDLGKERIVCGVATQGNSLHYEWVTQYKLLFSMDQIVWNTYKENEEDKTFQGNEDRRTVVRRYLQSFKPVRYIRFMPMKYHTFKTVRLEIYASDLDGPHVFPYQRSLELTWRIMEKQVASYQIEFENKSTIVSFDLPHSTVEYNLTNLQPYTEYSVRMKAITNNGLGSWTNWVNMKTRIAEPNAMPFNVSLTPTSSKDMDVAWKLRGIECLNGPLAGYRITWTSERGTTKTMDVGNTTTYKLTSLEARTLYNIIVSVRNTKYIGPPSEVVQATTFGDASSCSPRITSATAVSSTSIHVIWEPPPKGECRNGVLKGYSISWYIRDRGVRNYTRIDNPNVSKWNLTGLEKYSEYIINLRAYTTNYGPPYQVTAKTAEYGPSCSPNITYLILVSSTSIRVDWSLLPNKPCLNGILRGYRIAYRRLNETMLRFVNISNPNITTKLLSGLRKYTEYHIHVLGYTVEDGIHSKASVARTLEDAPVCSPKLASARNVSSTCIHVSWSPPPSGSCRNGILRGYRLFYSNTKTGKTLVMNISDSVTTTVDVTGLSKYTAYSFRILGYTVKDSPMSNEMKRTTSEDAPDCSPKLKSVQALSSTSIRVTWYTLPTSPCTNGIVRGYKIKYKRHGGRILTFKIINGGATTTDIKGLNKFTFYKFQVLAYTIKDGSLSNSLPASTTADAPSTPVNVNRTLLPANGSVGPRVQIGWDEPREKNGVIQKYTLVYMYNKDKSTERTIVIQENGQPTHVYSIAVVGGTTFSFRINAYTIEDGPYQKGEDLIIPAYGSPVIISPQKNKTVSKGEPIRLICNATGHPAPNVSWSKSSGSLKPWYVSGNVLVIPRAELTDAGTYICTAKNTYRGKLFVTRVDAFVTVKLRPHSPVPVSTQITHLSIRVHWKKPESHGYPVLMYSVHRAELDGAGQEVTSRSYHVNEDVHDYEVGGINGGKTYKFYVTAWNTHGESVKDHSKSITVNVRSP